MVAVAGPRQLSKWSRHPAAHFLFTQPFAGTDYDTATAKSSRPGSPRLRRDLNERQMRAHGEAHGPLVSVGVERHQEIAQLGEGARLLFEVRARRRRARRSRARRRAPLQHMDFIPRVSTGWIAGRRAR